MGKKFTRSKDKILGGVCGGLANYFGLDQILVRTIALLAILFGGIGFIPYIIMWIVIPDSDKTEPVPNNQTIRQDVAKTYQNPTPNASTQDQNSTQTNEWNAILSETKQAPKAFFDADTTQNTTTQNTNVMETKNRGNFIAGITLIGLGVLFLIDQLFPDLEFWEYIGKFWPVILIAIGVSMLLKNRDRKHQSEPEPHDNNNNNNPFNT